MQGIEIPVPEGILNGDLEIPTKAKAIILFAHGSGSSRKSLRNIQVAKSLYNEGFGIFLFDLLTTKEEAFEVDIEYRFNIELLAKRLDLATKWIQQNYPDLLIGYFGASTGAAAAIMASVCNNIFAIVSRGGRPDLAKEVLQLVKAPTLLIVGSLDVPVIAMNQEAMKKMRCEKEMILVEGATHLFEESGKLNKVADLANSWFLKHLQLFRKNDLRNRQDLER